MKLVSRWLDRFCYNHPNLGIPNLMKFIAIGNVAVYLLDTMFRNYATLLLMFNPTAVLQGQVWRLITFLFVPISGGTGLLGVLFFLMSTFFYYYIGTALEQHWGTTRFNVFYFLGAILNLLIGFAFNSSISMHYVNMSMFFSFATLYPDMQVLLYGILPLKIKWLAWFDVALFAYDFVRYAAAGLWLYALLPIIALLNYFIFFWDDILNLFGRGKAKVQHRTNPQTINFKKAQKEIRQQRGYLHKCAVCGITDTDDPDMEFRYCSKCNGYYCYCMNHINNHSHVE